MAFVTIDAKLLECSVCCQRLNDARALDCQHLFCCACLKVVDGFVACPECSCHTRVPRGFVEQLPCPVRFMEILHSVANLSSDRVVPSTSNKQQQPQHSTSVVETDMINLSMHAPAPIFIAPSPLPSPTTTTTTDNLLPAPAPAPVSISVPEQFALALPPIIQLSPFSPILTLRRVPTNALPVASPLPTTTTTHNNIAESPLPKVIVSEPMVTSELPAVALEKSPTTDLVTEELPVPPPTTTIAITTATNDVSSPALAAAQPEPEREPMDATTHLMDAEIDHRCEAEPLREEPNPSDCTTKTAPAAPVLDQDQSATDTAIVLLATVANSVQRRRHIPLQQEEEEDDDVTEDEDEDESTSNKSNNSKAHAEKEPMVLIDPPTSEDTVASSSSSSSSSSSGSSLPSSSPIVDPPSVQKRRVSTTASNTKPSSRASSSSSSSREKESPPPSKRQREPSPSPSPPTSPTATTTTTRILPPSWSSPPNSPKRVRIAESPLRKSPPPPPPSASSSRASQKASPSSRVQIIRSKAPLMPPVTKCPAASAPAAPAPKRPRVPQFSPEEPCWFEQDWSPTLDGSEPSSAYDSSQETLRTRGDFKLACLRLNDPNENPEALASLCEDLAPPTRQSAVQDLLKPAALAVLTAMQRFPQHEGLQHEGCDTVIDLIKLITHKSELLQTIAQIAEMVYNVVSVMLSQRSQTLRGAALALLDCVLNRDHKQVMGPYIKLLVGRLVHFLGEHQTTEVRVMACQVLSLAFLYPGIASVAVSSPFTAHFSLINIIAGAKRTPKEVWAACEALSSMLEHDETKVMNGYKNHLVALLNQSLKDIRSPNKSFRSLVTDMLQVLGEPSQ